MKGNQFLKRVLLTYFLLLLALTACAPAPATVITTTIPPTVMPTLPTESSQPETPAAAISPAGQAAIVAFVQDGDILIWDEATAQSETIFSAGDVISVTMSDDGQFIAFLRRSVVKRSELDWYEQSALWAVDLNGENPRELVSAEELRGLLSASETDSTNIPQMEWIPGTHRLLYTGWTYFVQAEGESHATPAGLYLVDANELTNSVLLPAEGNNLRFVPSPDGQQIALISTAGLGFISSDGSDHRPDVFPYGQVGLGGQAFPSVVWTWDARAILLATYLEKTPETDPGLALWRVPLEGSPTRLTDLFTGSHPDSITFSPNGRHAAFYRGSALGEIYSWFVTPLPGDQGPLAISRSAHLFWQNVHWSPAGMAYAVTEQTLFQLCPDATQNSEICGEGFELGGNLASIHWLDGNRFLFVTREPYDLYFGRLDGTRVRIAEGAETFAAVGTTCRNDSEFAAGGEGPAYTSITLDTMFKQTWRIRNSGTCTWDPTYRLGSLEGERLNGPQSLQVGETVPPGAEIELSVTLTAPGTARTYQGDWQLFAPDGKPFGVRLPVDITVPSHTVMDLPSQLVAARIPTGGDRIAFGEGAIWTTTWQTVYRIDANTNQVVASIPVGEFASLLAVGEGAVWVSGLNGINRIDPSTNSISAFIPIDPSVSMSGIGVGEGSVWVSGFTGYGDGTVFRIDPDTNHIIAAIPVLPWPSQIAVTQDAVWVTSPNNPVLTKIDPSTNEVAAEIKLDCGTGMLTVDDSAIWIPCDSIPNLYRIDPVTNRIVARIAVGNHSRGVAIIANSVWVTSLTDETLTVIDPATKQVVAVYRVSRPVDAIAVQGELWVITGGGVLRIKP